MIHSYVFRAAARTTTMSSGRRLSETDILYKCCKSRPHRQHDIQTSLYAFFTVASSGIVTAPHVTKIPLIVSVTQPLLFKYQRPQPGHVADLNS